MSYRLLIQLLGDNLVQLRINQVAEHRRDITLVVSD
jgi:hypothetical protein